MIHESIDTYIAVPINIRLGINTYIIAAMLKFKAERSFSEWVQMHLNVNRI